MTKPGPFNVGHEARTVTSAEREIPVDVWYPTEAKRGTATTYFGLFTDEKSFDGANRAEASEYPVIVYSHGTQGFGGTSATLMRHFASHGWIAVAPTHVGHTLSDPPPDKATIFAQRIEDMRNAIAVAASIKGAKTDRVLAIGHSFGGRTVWALAGAADPSFKEPRVAAVIAMASADDEIIVDYAAAKVPVFLMSGTADPIGQTALWEKVAAANRWWIDIEGACHQTFALGGCADLADDEGFPLVDSYALAFARQTLFSEPNPLLDGKKTLSAKVHLTH